MRSRAEGAAWIALLAAALLAQAVVTIVRTRIEGSVPLWALITFVAIALVLGIRVRQWRRAGDEDDSAPGRNGR